MKPSTSLLIALLFTTLLGVQPVLADESAAHYSAEKVMAQSALFSGLNKQQLAVVAPLESAMQRMDSSLAELDLAIALSEGWVDGAQRDLWSARLAERAGTFGQFFDSFQARFNEQGIAYERIFSAAIERSTAALAKELGGPVVECSPNQATFGLSGPGGAGAKKCPGENVSTKLAAAWDADTVLASELETLGDAGWPELASYVGGEAPLPTSGNTGSPESWFSLSLVARGIPEAAELLDAIDIAAEDARRALVAQSRAIDPSSPDGEAQAAAIRASAKKLRAYSETAKANVGDALWSAFGRVSKRNKALRASAPGFCFNPVDWEACSGSDRSVEVREALMDDRKLVRELQKQLEKLGTP